MVYKPSESALLLLFNDRMRKSILKPLIISTLTIFFTYFSYANEKVVSDSLVSGLKCENLSKASVMNAIDLNQFTDRNHIPIRNWSTQSGIYQIANCWSLSHAQRLMFYLGRFNKASMFSPEEDAANILDLFRGERPLLSENSRHSTSLAPLPYQVFHFKKPDLVSSVLDGIQNKQGAWGPIYHGLQDTGTTSNKVRNFTTEIEYYQKSRFYQASNLEMALSDDVYNKNRNEYYAIRFRSDLRFKILPMVNLKAGLIVQHIVLIKAFENKPNGDIVFTVYDSNAPGASSKIIFDNASKTFSAPDVFRFTNVKNFRAPILITPVDDNEMQTITETLFEYYKVLCQD